MSQTCMATSLTVLEIQRQKWTGGILPPAPVAGIMVRVTPRSLAIALLWIQFSISCYLVFSFFNVISLLSKTVFTPFS